MVPGTEGVGQLGEGMFQAMGFLSGLDDNVLEFTVSKATQPCKYTKSY